MLVGRDVAEWIGLEPGDAVAVTAVDDAGADVRRQVTTTGVLSTGGPEDGLVFLVLGDLDDLAGSPGRLDVVEYSVAASAPRIEALAARIAAEVPDADAGPVTRLTATDATVLATLRSLLVLVAAIVSAATANACALCPTSRRVSHEACTAACSIAETGSSGLSSVRAETAMRPA